jgi:hypothetical protein
MPGRLESSGEPISPLDVFGDQANKNVCEADGILFLMPTDSAGLPRNGCFPKWYLAAEASLIVSI